MAALVGRLHLNLEAEIKKMLSYPSQVLQPPPLKKKQNIVSIVNNAVLYSALLDERSGHGNHQYAIAKTSIHVPATSTPLPAVPDGALTPKDAARLKLLIK
jgi:hypothetical protein